MPEMNGLETIPEIRKVLPFIPIIMFSTLTERGAEATLDALALGATDYVPSRAIRTWARCPRYYQRAHSENKISVPYFSLSADGHWQALPCLPGKNNTSRLELVHSLLSQCFRGLSLLAFQPGGRTHSQSFCPLYPRNSLYRSLLPAYAPILPCYLQAAGHQVRRACSRMPTGALLEPGRIWIAPGDYHMVVREDGGVIRLYTHQGPRENFCRPSVDVLFIRSRKCLREISGCGFSQGWGRTG